MLEPSLSYMEHNNATNSYIQKVCVNVQQHLTLIYDMKIYFRISVETSFALMHTNVQKGSHTVYALVSKIKDKCWYRSLA
jgi:hypothetical protein